MLRPVFSVLSCATVYDFGSFFVNSRKTKEKMQIKGRIQSWNVFIEIQKFLTFLLVKFFMRFER